MSATVDTSSTAATVEMLSRPQRQRKRTWKAAAAEEVSQDILQIEAMAMADSLELDISKQLSIAASGSGSTQWQPTVSTSGLDTRLVDLKTRFRGLL